MNYCGGEGQFFLLHLDLLCVAVNVGREQDKCHLIFGSHWICSKGQGVEVGWGGGVIIKTTTS